MSTNNPMDIIQTLFCREHNCFKAFRNGSCISCLEERTVAEINKAEKQAKKDGLSADQIIQDDVMPEELKKRRGRKKGSKNKVKRGK